MELRTIQLLVAGVVVLTGAIFYARQERAEPSLDEKVLAQLKKAGSDLSKPHTIQFYLYFPSAEAANAAAVKVQTLSFAVVRVDKAAKGDDWLLLASKRMVPGKEAITKVSSELTAVAKDGKGDYDGWEAQVTE